MAHYVDITELFVRKAQQLRTDAVVTQPQFNLFQGTHALEIDNDKLDSGLIALSQTELDFDCTAPRSLSDVLWVSDALLRSVFTWLDNSSLSVTVFSCRYVEELLVNYNKNIKAGLENCIFGMSLPSGDPEYQLVHKVLRGVVLGVLHFVRLCLTLGQAGVVYEEEDINTQNMNLDILSAVSTSDILNEIQESLQYIQKQFPEERDSMLLQAIFQILAKLNDIPYYLSTKVSKAGNFMNTSIVDSLKTYTDVLRENVEYLNTLNPIEGCFTMGIQKRLDNKSPTRDLISPHTENYTSLPHFLNDLTQILAISQRSTSQDIIAHASNFANTKHHVLARAIYPLFLIRDDRTVLGEEPFTDFLREELVNFMGIDSETFTTENEVVKVKVNELLEQMSTVYFDWINALNQNPCRQRQHMSRSIMHFDMIQVTAEDLEMTLKDNFMIQDEFEYNGQLVPALPITSWIFYMKMDVMLQVVLRGMELELYNTWELHLMYTYAAGLADHLIQHLDRVIKFNEHKINKINNMGKQLKKKKGDQKQRYKEKILRKQAVELPKLEQCVKMIEKLRVKYEIYKGLCQLELIHIENLLQKGALNIPDFPYIKSPEVLFKFRMKPFSMVGVPAPLDYAAYNRALTMVLRGRYKHTQEQVNAIKTQVMALLKTVVDDIQNKDTSVGYNICSDDWLQWHKDLQRSCIMLALNIGKEPTEGRVSVERENLHRYFPLLKRGV